MAILTEADRAIFFPRVAATGNELTGLILATQTMIEAKIGRTLEIKNYVQSTKSINGIAQIQYTPVVEITKVETRRVRRDSYSYTRSFSSNTSWVQVAIGDYEFDEDNQRIELLSGLYLDSSRRELEIRIIYTAGFDFTDNTDTDVLKIKSIAGQMLQFVALPSATKGISSVSVDYQSVSYGGTKLEEQMSNQIEALQCYRPLVFPFTV